MGAPLAEFSLFTYVCSTSSHCCISALCSLSLSLCVCVGTTHEMLCTCSTRACTEVGASQLAEVCRIHSNLVPASWRLHDEIPAYFSTEMLRSSSRRRLEHYSRKSAGFHHLQAGTRELCISHTCTETHMCVCLLMFIRTYMHVRSTVSSLGSSPNHAINFCTVYSVKDMHGTWRG